MERDFEKKRREEKLVRPNLNRKLLPRVSRASLGGQVDDRGVGN
jgi:hypothetical protein